MSKCARREIEKFKTDNVARVSKWNEQSIIELGTVFVPRRFRDSDESQPTLASLQGREGSDPNLRERDCVTPSGEVGKLGRIIF